MFLLSRIDFRTMLVVLLYISLSLYGVDLTKTNKEPTQSNQTQKFSQLIANQTYSTAPRVQASKTEPARPTQPPSRSAQLSPSQTKGKPIQTLVNRSNHENSSPSTISSFYNYLSNKNKPAQAEANQQATSKQLTDEHQKQQRGHFALGLPQIHNELALDKDQSQLINRPQMDDMVVPLMTVNGNNLMPGPNTFEPTMYDQPLAIQSNNREQILATFYMNGNQDGTGQPQLVHSSSDPNQQYAGSPAGLYGAQQDTYDHQIGYGQYSPSHNPLRQGYHDQADRGHLTPNADVTKIDQSIQEKRENLLSNAQLVSLIDELKEFNSRQASKVQPSTSLVEPTRQQIEQQRAAVNIDKYDNDDDDGELSEQSSPQVVDADSGERKKSRDDKHGGGRRRPNERRQTIDDQTPKMNTEDLAKLAKFLMTKEGTNMKFQLGLDRESPDDGDEVDDRDPLLETKNKQVRTRPRDSMRTIELEDLDRKHSEVASQMDKLIDDATERAREGEGNDEKPRKKQSRKVVKQVKKDDLMDDRARKRRDQSGVTNKSRGAIKPAISELKNISPVKTNDADQIKTGHNENFAKMLIKQELLEDQQESTAAAAQQPAKVTSSRGNNMGHNRVTKRARLPDENLYNADDAEATIPNVDTKNSAERGEEEHRYHKRDRNKDHIALINELKNTRRTKAKTRSRIPMPLDSLVRRALDGEMGLQTERHPDGRLLLRTNRDGDILTLKLPNKKTGTGRSITETHDDDDGSLNDSEIIPSQVEPEGGSSPSSHLVDRVKIQSSQPVKNEYPISERVSNGIGKLSDSLDRYFNDGFLQEIEAKSKLSGGDKHDNKEVHQPQSSNVNESPASVVGRRRAINEQSRPKNKSRQQQIDNDFDVNVSVDGKRDNDNDDDSDDYEDGGGKGVKNMDEKAKLSRNNKLVKKGEISNKVGKSDHKGIAKRSVRKKKRPSDSESRAIRRDESSGNEKLVFENSARLMPNLDPVESESLETPIGPDNTEPDLSTAMKVKSSSGSNVSTSNGKKVPGKFYEEPEWRSR